MLVLGLESSCDETSAAVVLDGKKILSNIVATQIPFHKIYNGVVPEIASRKHIEWITPVVKQATKVAGVELDAIDAIAATNRPGLVGGLLVGLTYGKALAFALKKPFIAINHMLGHLYGSQLEYNGVCNPAVYPFLGLLVSGGHTIISIAKNFNEIEVLGTTVDDSIGEAFDKVAKFYDLGYPGGVVIDRLATTGDKESAHFPTPKLGKGHDFDVSYSGLKTSVIHQKDLFWNKNIPYNKENLCAAFQETAVKILVDKVAAAQKATGLKTIVAGGGVAANTRLRSMLKECLPLDIEIVFPPLKLCGDNAAMIAGVGYQYLMRGETSPLNTPALARVSEFKHKSTRI